MLPLPWRTAAKGAASVSSAGEFDAMSITQPPPSTTLGNRVESPFARWPEPDTPSKMYSAATVRGVGVVSTTISASRGEDTGVLLAVLDMVDAEVAARTINGRLFDGVSSATSMTLIGVASFSAVVELCRNADVEAVLEVSAEVIGVSAVDPAVGVPTSIVLTELSRLAPVDRLEEVRMDRADDATRERLRLLGKYSISTCSNMSMISSTSTSSLPHWTERSFSSKQPYLPWIFSSCAMAHAWRPFQRSIMSDKDVEQSLPLWEVHRADPCSRDPGTRPFSAQGSMDAM